MNPKDPTLKPGAFYWALPVFDPDTDEEWVNKEQPARFVGYGTYGEELWTWLDVNGIHWPCRWHGDEIKL